MAGLQVGDGWDIFGNLRIYENIVIVKITMA